MEKGGIAQFLTAHAQRGPVSFHMPGHKGGAFYERHGYGDFLKQLADCDITEIPGADNLFQTEGIIGETAEKYRQLYEVKRSYLLVNGTSGGLIAAILASVPPGKKLIMARNCHKSVFNALTLGQIEPVYAYPTVVEKYGISGPVEAGEIGRLLEAHPDAAAVVLPSPNYYGICSDISAIAGQVHKHGKVLIVDQAHGAHLKFFRRFGQGEGLPAPAEESGADIVVNSIHKTLASFTQSAVLNLNSDRVERYVLEDKLQAIQSTSPSYLLMASLDVNAEILEAHGPGLFAAWRENIEAFYRQAPSIPGLELMELPGRMDTTKLNVDMSAYGISGSRLEKLLLEKDIFPELVTGDLLMCMTGLGNTKEDMERLLSALREVALAHGPCLPEEKRSGRRPGTAALLWAKKRPLHGVPVRKQLLELELCRGKICAASVIPYPPGIPFLCPGEEIGEEEIRYIRELRAEGEKVIGVDEEGRIAVGV
ncbi:MAG: hypothetical protein Q4C22_06570 [Bacillota bacterium]|nr:hypothetical protein [Bacillota bacterium]